MGFCSLHFTADFVKGESDRPSHVELLTTEVAMIAQTKNSNTRTVKDDGINSADAVVFRGDGEPRTPESLVATLTDIVSRRGIEADNYSNGGVGRRAGRAGCQSAVQGRRGLHAERYTRQSPGDQGCFAVAVRAQSSKSRATSITIPETACSS